MIKVRAGPGTWPMSGPIREALRVAGFHPGFRVAPTLPTSSRCVYSRNLHSVQVTPKGILLRKESRQYPEATGAQAAEDLLSRLGAGSWPALQEGPGGGAPKGTPSKEKDVVVVAAAARQRQNGAVLGGPWRLRIEQLVDPSFSRLLPSFMLMASDGAEHGSL